MSGKKDQPGSEDYEQQCKDQGMVNLCKDFIGKWYEAPRMVENQKQKVANNPENRRKIISRKTKKAERRGMAKWESANADPDFYREKESLCNRPGYDYIKDVYIATAKHGTKDFNKMMAENPGAIAHTFGLYDEQGRNEMLRQEVIRIVDRAEKRKDEGEVPLNRGRPPKPLYVPPGYPTSQFSQEVPRKHPSWGGTGTKIPHKIRNSMKDVNRIRNVGRRGIPYYRKYEANKMERCIVTEFSDYRLQHLAEYRTVDVSMVAVVLFGVQFGESMPRLMGREYITTKWTEDNMITVTVSYALKLKENAVECGMGDWIEFKIPNENWYKHGVHDYTR